MENPAVWIEKEKEAVIAFHKRNVEAIKDKISELQKELQKSNYRIAELTGISVLDIDDIVEGVRSGRIAHALAQDNYSKSFPLWKKAQYVLLRRNRIATTRQLAEMIIEQENGILDPILIPELVSNLGATLLPKVKDGVAFRRLVMRDEFYYGLIDWWNDDGNVDDLFL